ncbi:phage terminase large subunit family protein [Endozoicomonas ascidiicola]|uniref:phage terminase large subunit family protein n=1 Tax=Endozoicomonas ascidiicola TaxID=1698521 RepID=UPI0008377E79|nr:phage terminase large subunit family protein [Endozoicomonas ascidiicola]
MNSPYFSGFFAGLKPDTRMTVSEWADEHRILPMKSAKEAGRWRTVRTPYLKEIMDCLSPSSSVEQVAFMKGAQVGGTECGNNWLGYVIHHTPGPMMYVLPTLDMAKRTSKQRIAPMIEAMPVLRELVKDPRSRDSGNTQMVKEFPNGVLIITGANSATGLRSMPARFLFLDEIDAYEDDVDGEGSPINLAIKRTATFSRNRKVLMVSTPNIAGASKIESAYQASDQRQYHVPCVKCSYLQPIEWQQIRFENQDPETACFECINCQHRMGEHDKPKLLGGGQWIPMNPEANGKIRGFHLSSLYSPNGWYSWKDAVADFLAAKDNPILLKDWTNTVLGQTWQEQGETVDHELLYQRREHYPVEVPWSVEVLTCGVDVQDDRVEFEVVGWGAGEESWSIDYVRLYGDLSRPDIWKILADRLRKSYRRQDGVLMNLAQICMDSGGHFTDEVYAFSRKQGSDWLIPIKGASQAGKPIATFPKTRNKKGVYLTLVGTDTAKELVYQRYRILEPGAGYCHWPIMDCFDEDYFKQATAEEKVRKYKHGVAYFEWDARKKRNEALDCRVYALTAVRILQQHRGLNLEQLAAQRPEPEVQMEQDEPTDIAANRHRRTSRSTYLNG